MPAQELLNLQNVRKAILNDFELLGIFSTQQVAQAEPYKFFNRCLGGTQKQIQNQSIWDGFTSIIQESKTGGKLLGGNNSRFFN